MVRAVLCSLVLSLIVIGCDKKDDDEQVGPVWILNVTVRDGAFPNREIPECAHVKWKYRDETEDRDAACRNSNNFVKVWDKITEDVTIYYRVECAGYSPSVEERADFSYALVDTLADGQEVILNRVVYIYPE
ncbi:hypothetical protein HUU59_08905 [bacterium]|nr:hypothetical protein [bacterium]